MIVDIVMFVVVLSRCSGSGGSGSSRSGVVVEYRCVGIEIWVEIVGITMKEIMIMSIVCWYIVIIHYRSRTGGSIGRAKDNDVEERMIFIVVCIQILIVIPRLLLEYIFLFFWLLLLLLLMWMEELLEGSRRGRGGGKRRRSCHCHCHPPVARRRRRRRRRREVEALRNVLFSYICLPYECTMWIVVVGLLRRRKRGCNISLKEK